MDTQAAVSLGGKDTKEAITVLQHLATRTPNSQTNKVVQLHNQSSIRNAKTIGVFVSIVSTKVPFEFKLRDDINEIQQSVKRAYQH
ncbi:hypothetical protein ACHAXN_001026 [Cyclotella atomus]